MVVRVWVLAVVLGLLVAPVLVLSIEGLAIQQIDDGTTVSGGNSEGTSATTSRRSLGTAILDEGFLSEEIGHLFQPRQISNSTANNIPTIAPLQSGEGVSFNTSSQDSNTTNTTDNDSDGEPEIFPGELESDSPISFGLPYPSVGNIPVVCGFKWNVTARGCSRRITLSSRQSQCDCYSFCGNALRGCYDAGEQAPFFDCFIEDIVVGCSDDVDIKGAVAKVGVNAPCPEGFLCSPYGKQSCEDVRQIPRLLGLGDIHAGIYCPGSDNRVNTGYQNCDVGFYCPNSTSRIPCPPGYFCPHKTAEPDITCSGCAEGATTLVRPSYVYTIMVIAVAVMLVIILWEVFDRYNRQLYRQLHDLQESHLDGVQDVVYKRKHLKKLRVLRPKLKGVERRLREQFGFRLNDEDTVLSKETSDGKMAFDAAKLFDALDTRMDEELPYRKINQVLRLKSVQFHEFVVRMNEIAGEPPDMEDVERHVFITQFLRVFNAVSHLQPSPKEAARIFDDVAEQGTTKDGEVPHRLFYSSILTEFLQDDQINALLKSFQHKKELQGMEETEELAAAAPKEKEQAVVKYAPQVYKRSFFGLSETSFSISRDEFIARYPTLLAEVSKSLKTINSGFLFTSQLSLHKGIDVAFQGLSVAIEVKDRPVKVLNDITGRLFAGSMTAIMGGPGSGKTCLLDALSGRAFYGEISGSIQINGHNTSLDKHRGSVGYVPEIDALYAELTVRENILFSGKFQLAYGTPLEEIEDLADATMATLNLSRIMHVDVGHKHQGGLSDFERKSVSIALELMKKPRILFLENPTKNLDPVSALQIAKALKKFVDMQGITVCATLDQARRDVFELFDSILLLGVCGKLVYHGPVLKIGKYFNKLNYFLSDGESLTDWILDIATGRLPPPVKELHHATSTMRSTDDTMTLTTDKSSQQSADTPKTKKVTFAMTGHSRHSASGKRQNIACNSTKPFDTAAEQAKATCQLLNENWKKHVKALPKKKRAKYGYEPPLPFGLPRAKEKPPLIDQLVYNLHRLLILAERNWFYGFIDTTIIVVTVILITLMDGVAEPTRDVDMKDLNYENVADPSSAEALVLEFPKLFAYATIGVKEDIEQYATKVGVMFAVIVSVVATKLFRKHEKQFYREAASGYSVGAYFLAMNIMGTLEQSLQAILSALFAYIIRNSLSAWYSYVVHFLMLSWVSASWGVLFSLLIPKQYVFLVTGFLVSFFALLFCGAIPPISFEAIYDHVSALIASGLLSPTRFFVESMAVAEARCLPVQSGFTEFSRSFNETTHSSRTFERVAVEMGMSSFQMLHYGLNDFSQITQRSCNGWYWGAIPCLFAGFVIRWLSLGAIYGANRSGQAKRPTGDSRRWFFAYCFILTGLLAAWLYFILRGDWA